ncbi:MAG: hypothetical protein SGI88_05645 [Candidatus Hydrogenedentes bacterium]|nr:hypothetical protein [Candidatus Hydrogenedentota bacterium]
MLPRNRFVVLALIASLLLPASAQDAATQSWLYRFSLGQINSEAHGVSAGEIGKLPTFTVRPAKTGRQLVRVSLTFAPATFPNELSLQVTEGDSVFIPGVRVLTLHPGIPKSVRRAIVTFPFEFPDFAARTFQLSLAQRDPAPMVSAERGEDDWIIEIAGSTLAVNGNRIDWTRPDGSKVKAELIAPARTDANRGELSVVESGKHYKWIRAAIPGAQWPRIIEVRADSLGGLVIRAHLQRLEKGDGVAPDFGWKISGAPTQPFERHAFAMANEAFKISLPASDVTFPDAHLLKRGYVESDGSGIVYMRCTADESVPMQETSWRTATIAFSPSGAAPLNSLLEPSHEVTFDSSQPAQIDLSQWPDLDRLREYHRSAIAKAALLGDDYGNVTSFAEGSPASYYGMNRLNHCPAIFEEYYRSGDPRMRETAVQWCSNMYDLSLWWGDTPDFGGTRYNAAVAAGEKEHEGDTSFLWRTNWTSHFCTKGFDSFFLAYEETGDPRFLTALNAQIEYAKQFIFVDKGECRNIGDVADFMRLYWYTGLPEYRDEALRLFRELRTKLGDDNLFSQGGQPIVKEGPFIDDDQHGYDAPFAKPYIIGYALTGLPDLLEVAPDEPRLRDTVRAVADFLAESIDPAGGWRYPHPNSSSMILSQALEHAAQIANAARVLEQRGEDIDNLLDAIEKVLQQRVMGYQRTGTILSGLSGWESSQSPTRRLTMHSPLAPANK